MHFERQICFSKCIKLYFFPVKKIIKKICVPTLPKIFRPLTRNTLIFHLALAGNDTKKFSYSLIIHLSFDSGGDVCSFFLSFVSIPINEPTAGF